MRRQVSQLISVNTKNEGHLNQPKLEYGIADEDIYNFDETGFAMGMVTTGKVMCSSDCVGEPSLTQPGNREWVTVVECVALGKWCLR